MICVIVPLSRPTMLLNLVRNWNRQKHQDKRLCVVENGPAVGACKAMGFAPDMLATSEEHQSWALNTGLEEAKRSGYRYWAKMDDDDYYGPEYLTQTAMALSHGWDAVGRSAHYVQLSSGRILYKHQEGANLEVTMVEGPTLAGPVDAAPLFRVLDWGEDCAWVDDVRAAGGRVWAAEGYGYCYRRRGPEHKHTYPISDAGLENFARAMGPVYYAGRALERTQYPPSPSFPRLRSQEADFTLHPCAKMEVNHA